MTRVAVVFMYFDILFLSPYRCLCTMFSWPLRFGWLLVLGLYKDDYVQILNVCTFDYTVFEISGKVEIPIPCLTSTFEWMSFLQLTVLSRSAIVL